MSAAKIRDKDFAKRIVTAVENNSHAPSGHGRQRWLQGKLKDDLDLEVSFEAVRKWFAGEARPRPSVMSKIAQALEVDEAWLSLGISPTVTPREKTKQNALTNGAVNLVAAQIQLAGGNIAFPEDETSENDLFAIVRGKKHEVTVRYGDLKPTFKLAVYRNSRTVIAVVPTSQPTVFEFVRVPNELIERYGLQRGGFTELDIENTEQGFLLKGELLPTIQSFDNLEGETRKLDMAERIKAVRKRFDNNTSPKLEAVLDTLLEALNTNEEVEKPH